LIVGITAMLSFLGKMAVRIIVTSIDVADLAGLLKTRNRVYEQRTEAVVRGVVRVSDTTLYC
jgi:hypothetical protein